MKDFDLVLAFRRAYFQFNYIYDKEKNLNDLYQWTNEWCKENGIPDDMYNLFFHLAQTYVDKEFKEALIVRYTKNCKRKKKKDF